jgi:uncharacterized protein YndB with AHSA1/START domain
MTSIVDLRAVRACQCEASSCATLRVTNFQTEACISKPSKTSGLVIIDAYTKEWKPSEKPFMTVIAKFENEGGKTKCTARVLHWTVADREAHEEMGFHQGWGPMRRPACGP